MCSSKSHCSLSSWRKGITVCNNSILVCCWHCLTSNMRVQAVSVWLMMQDSAEEKEERKGQEWSAPCYFDISIMGCGDSFGAAPPCPWLHSRRTSCSSSAWR